MSTCPSRLPRYAAFPVHCIHLPLRAIAAGCKPGVTMLDPFASITERSHDGARWTPKRYNHHGHLPTPRVILTTEGGVTTTLRTHGTTGVVAHTLGLPAKEDGWVRGWRGGGCSVSSPSPSSEVGRRGL
jgi:hypothetical protein